MSATAPSRRTSGAAGPGLLAVLAFGAAEAQGDLATPEGAATLLLEVCPFEGLEGPASARAEGGGGVRLALAARDGFRSCELTLEGRDGAFLEAMAEELSARLADRIEVEDAETVEDGLIWRWAPEEGLRGEMELSIDPEGELSAIVALERGPLMENSE